jgi:DNA-binding protein YbaB
VSVTLAPEVVDPDDIEMLQDLVVAAIHDANRIAQEKQSESMGGLTGGIDLSAFGLG